MLMHWERSEVSPRPPALVTQDILHADGRQLFRHSSCHEPRLTERSVSQRCLRSHEWRLKLLAGTLRFNWRRQLNRFQARAVTVMAALDACGAEAW